MPRHRYRLPPGSLDCHSLQLRCARVFRRHEHQRHAQHARRRPEGRVPPRRSHVHQRGLRHAGHAAHPRDASAPGPVSVQRVEDRRRQAVRGLSLLVSNARRNGQALQHVRTAPVDTCRAADDFTQLLAGRTLVTLGRLDPRRDLLFVADTVDGSHEPARPRRSTEKSYNSEPGGRSRWANSSRLRAAPWEWTPLSCRRPSASVPTPAK